MPSGVYGKGFGMHSKKNMKNDEGGNLAISYEISNFMLLSCPSTLDGEQSSN
jgi:hypothetical protein